MGKGRPRELNVICKTAKLENWGVIGHRVDNRMQQGRLVGGSVDQRARSMSSRKLGWGEEGVVGYRVDNAIGQAAAGTRELNVIC